MGVWKKTTHWEGPVIPRMHFLASDWGSESVAQFKDRAISFIEFLQKVKTRLYWSEHSRNIDTDLRNTQLTSFECLNQPLNLIRSTNKEANNWGPKLFLLMMQIQKSIQFYSGSFAVKQTLASIQSWGKMFSSENVCGTFVKVPFWSPKKNNFESCFTGTVSFLRWEQKLAWNQFKGTIRTYKWGRRVFIHTYLKFLNVLRHSDDAYGFMSSKRNIGLGYVCTLTSEKYFRNSMLPGRFSRCLY